MEANDRVMSEEKWFQTYQMMTTNALYKLNSTFDGLQLKTIIQQSLEAFNKTNVRFTSVKKKRKSALRLTYHCN